MEDLKKNFINLDLKKIKTYIQSGNVLFESDDNQVNLQDRIEKSLENNFGFRIPVIIRSLNEMENIIRNMPFTEQQINQYREMSDSEVLYISLFASPISQRDMETINNYEWGEDKCIASEKEIYMLFKNSIRNSKPAIKIQKMETSSTIRNYKTIIKLVELGKTLQL